MVALSRVAQRQRATPRGTSVLRFETANSMVCVLTGDLALPLRMLSTNAQVNQRWAQPTPPEQDSPMHSTTENHYQTLQVSQTASQEVIEKMFRFLATKYHPDAGGDKQTFNQIIAAFEVLRDAGTRDQYDLDLKQDLHEVARLRENSKQAGPDAAIRHELLCLFYARRREQSSSPALGTMSIEKTLNVDSEALDFHLWYFKEKGWIKRCEDGGYAITAEGVDQIDATELRMATHLRIASTPDCQPGSLMAV